MDVRRDFDRLPPQGDVSTLDGLVDDWLVRGESIAGRDIDWIEFVCQAESFPEAVRRAVYSRNAEGKMYPHQTRIPLAVMDEYIGSILSRMNKIRTAPDFESLYSALSRARVKGIGPVTEYDVAYRLSMYLDVPPDKVYIHAGVKEGAQELGLDVSGKRALDHKELPEALQRLPAYEVEDFLCTYREILGDVSETADE